jgi:hypothetical protein
MEIRHIDNTELTQLLELAILMYKVIDPSVNEFGAINTVMYEINTKEDFTAIGLFDDNKLVGFMSGYCFSKKQFHFSGIYVIIKNNEWTKQLIEYCLDLIKQKGYSAWSVDTTNGNISSIVEKYGAEPLYTRYIKEIN